MAMVLTKIQVSIPEDGPLDRKKGINYGRMKYGFSTETHFYSERFQLFRGRFSHTGSFTDNHQ